jgi:hypothetical protein
VIVLSAALRVGEEKNTSVLYRHERYRTGNAVDIDSFIKSDCILEEIYSVAFANVRKLMESSVLQFDNDT